MLLIGRAIFPSSKHDTACFHKSKPFEDHLKEQCEAAQLPLAFGEDFLVMMKAQSHTGSQ